MSYDQENWLIWIFKNMASRIKEHWIIDTYLLKGVNRLYTKVLNFLLIGFAIDSKNGITINR